MTGMGGEGDRKCLWAALSSWQLPPLHCHAFTRALPASSPACLSTPGCAHSLMLGELYQHLPWNVAVLWHFAWRTRRFRTLLPYYGSAGNRLRGLARRLLKHGGTPRTVLASFCPGAPAFRCAHYCLRPLQPAYGGALRARSIPVSLWRLTFLPV